MFGLVYVLGFLFLSSTSKCENVVTTPSHQSDQHSVETTIASDVVNGETKVSIHQDLVTTESTYVSPKTVQISPKFMHMLTKSEKIEGTTVPTVIASDSIEFGKIIFRIVIVIIVICIILFILFFLFVLALVYWLPEWMEALDAALHQEWPTPPDDPFIHYVAKVDPTSSTTV